MGCGGSRALKEYLDHRGNNYGKVSDIEIAIGKMEELSGYSMKKIEKIEYNEFDYGYGVEHAQKWTIRAEYEDEKAKEKVFSVWINEQGNIEIQYGVFEDE